MLTSTRRCHFIEYVLLWFLLELIMLTFELHFDSEIAKAHFMLRFLKRICADFVNTKCLVNIYNVHVRSHLEYTSPVWHPFTQSDNDAIASIQKQFVIYPLRRSVRSDCNYRLPPYAARCICLNLELLSTRTDHAKIFLL